MPFRNFVAQAQQGVLKEEHEEFFRQMLVDVEEPIALYGLTHVLGMEPTSSKSNCCWNASSDERIYHEVRALRTSAMRLLNSPHALTSSGVPKYGNVTVNRTICTAPERKKMCPV